MESTRILILYFSIKLNFLLYMIATLKESPSLHTELDLLYCEVFDAKALSLT